MGGEQRIEIARELVYKDGTAVGSFRGQLCNFAVESKIIELTPAMVFVPQG
jgi:hypothetical protein